MPKNYPAFIIDRSRRSEASRFTDDFIVCTDKEAGFIARAYAVPKSRRSELAEKLAAPDAESRITYKVIGESLAVIEIVRMLNEPVAHINRIPPLLKKAMKAYLFGEEMAVRRGGMPLDDQIAAVKMADNRGGRREGAGRKRLGRKSVNLSLTQKAIDNICRVAKERGMTRSDLVIEWAEALSTDPHQGFLVEKTR